MDQNRPIQRIFMSALGLIIFVAAIWALSRVFAGHSVAEMTAEFRSRSIEQLLLAFGLTICSYGVLTGYDLLRLRYLKKVIPLPKAMLTSFLGFVFANNLGFFGGAGLRLRFYLTLGLSSYEVAKLIAFSAVTFWLGFGTLGGTMFLLHPPQPTADSWLTAGLIRALGVTLVFLIFVYLVQSREKWRDFSFRGRRYVFPSSRLRFGQMLISSLDWILASSVLYVLLPADMALTFPTYLAAFLCAQILGLASNVPGGLGVFETVLLYVLPVEPAHESGLIASLVIFRLVYYVIPLILATLVTGGLEIKHHVSAARRDVEL